MAERPRVVASDSCVGWQIADFALVAKLLDTICENSFYFMKGVSKALCMVVLLSGLFVFLEHGKYCRLLLKSLKSKLSFEK